MQEVIPLKGTPEEPKAWAAGASTAWAEREDPEAFKQGCFQDRRIHQEDLQRVGHHSLRLGACQDFPYSGQSS